MANSGGQVVPTFKPGIFGLVIYEVGVWTELSSPLLSLKWSRVEIVGIVVVICPEAIFVNCVAKINVNPNDSKRKKVKYLSGFNQLSFNL